MNVSGIIYNFAFCHETNFKHKMQKIFFLTDICTFGGKYLLTLKSDNCSSRLCKCCCFFSLKFTQSVTLTQMESNQKKAHKMTNKHAAEY